MPHGESRNSTGIIMIVCTILLLLLGITIYFKDSTAPVTAGPKVEAAAKQVQQRQRPELGIVRQIDKCLCLNIGGVLVPALPEEVVVELQQYYPTITTQVVFRADATWIARVSAMRAKLAGEEQVMAKLAEAHAAKVKDEADAVEAVKKPEADPQVAPAKE